MAIAASSICLLTIAALGALVWPLIPTYTFATCCIGVVIGALTLNSSIKKITPITKLLAEKAVTTIETMASDLLQGIGVPVTASTSS